MKSIKALVVFATFGLLLSGCASTAHVEKDDAVNFNNYKTYAWAENDDSSRIKKNSLQEASVREAVGAELAKANWKEAKDHPDVILKHDVLIEKAVKNNSNPVYSQPFTRTFYNPYSRRLGYLYYPSQFVGYDNDRYATREGTLTISMIDAKTDKVVWQGWATDEVKNRNITSKEIQGSVKSIFKKFDVVKKES